MVGAGGDDEQVLLDPPQIDAASAQADPAADERVVLVEPA